MATVRDRLTSGVGHIFVEVLTGTASTLLSDTRPNSNVYATVTLLARDHPPTTLWAGVLCRSSSSRSTIKEAEELARMEYHEVITNPRDEQGSLAPTWGDRGVHSRDHALTRLDDDSQVLVVVAGVNSPSEVNVCRSLALFVAEGIQCIVALTA